MSPSNPASAFPLILVIDDQLGAPAGPTGDRADVCRHLGLRDITHSPDDPKAWPVAENNTIADAVFVRGQSYGSDGTLKNDLPVALQEVEKYWNLTHDLSTHALIGRRCGMVLLDLDFPLADGSGARFGLEIMKAIDARFRPEPPPVIMFSAVQEGDVARDYAEAGGREFFPKPRRDETKQLKELLRVHGLVQDGGFPEERDEERNRGRERLVGSSLALLKALRAARRTAGTNLPVLIRGERGTGKDLLARFIHLWRWWLKPECEVTQRRDATRRGGHACGDQDYSEIRTFNVTGIPETLLESELFGHEVGAFTGAVTSKAGGFEKAKHGVVFLDEIGDLPPACQPKLLRILQAGKGRRIGATDEYDVAAKVLAATNAEVERQTSEGDDFRADLLDRLRSGGTVVLPALRDRMEDLPVIARAVLDEIDKRSGYNGRAIEDSAMRVLLGDVAGGRPNPWPGNVRTLRSVLARVVEEYPKLRYVFPAHLRMEGGDAWTPTRDEGFAALVEDFSAAARSGEVDVEAIDTRYADAMLTHIEAVAREIKNDVNGDMSKVYTPLCRRLLPGEVGRREARLIATWEAKPENSRGGKPSITSHCKRMLQSLLGRLRLDASPSAAVRFPTLMALMALVSGKGGGPEPGTGPSAEPELGCRAEDGEGA